MYPQFRKKYAITRLLLEKMQYVCIITVIIVISKVLWL